MSFREIIDIAAKALDVGGITVIVGGITVATGLFVRDAIRHARGGEAYAAYRRGIGRAVLLGLEFLVAADIIRTVAVAPTFQGVGVLALIVLVRTFLSFALELELEGRWPWQKRQPP